MVTTTLPWHVDSEGLCNCVSSRETSPHFFIMITSKAQIINTIKECCTGSALTKTEKFQVFCNVCDNMLHAGQITKAQHTRWTNVF
jgi:hypothetical protein